MLDYNINDQLKLNSRFFGLLVERDAVGFLEYINRTNNGADRNLYKDKYQNYGNESRLLYSEDVKNRSRHFIIGV